MKKFFAILLAVVTTLALLPSCGAGNDNDPTKITAGEFMRGAKYFMLGNGLGGTLFVVPDRAIEGYNTTQKVTDANGAVIEETVSGMTGSVNVGSKGGLPATFQYTCHYDEKGVPTLAVLTISTIPSAESNQTLVDYFNQAQPDNENGDANVDLRGVVVLNIDFRTNLFTMTEQGNDDDDDDIREIGGTVIVRRK